MRSVLLLCATVGLGSLALAASKHVADPGLTAALALEGAPAGAQEQRLKEELHQQAIREKLSVPLTPAQQKLEQDIIQQLYAVMDAFVAKDINNLAAHIHPRMIEFDSMSPYRDVGKASFLEHMFHFFASPQHIEDHFIRIKEPLVQGYGDGVAMVSFHYDAEASVGGQFNQNWGKATFLFVKDRTLGPNLGNVWLLAACHYATLRPSLR
jgi:ketosteroid isomerase-like protein